MSNGEARKWRCRRLGQAKRRPNTGCYRLWRWVFAALDPTYGDSWVSA